MVFYDPLPTELWFIIYKMEHSSFLEAVNKQIKTLNRDIELLNITEHSKIERGWGLRVGMIDEPLHDDGGPIAYDYFSDFPRVWAHCCPRVTCWTINTWNSFNRVHPNIFIHDNGSLDISTPQGAYRYDNEMRRKIVVEYLFDW